MGRKKKVMEHDPLAELADDDGNVELPEQQGAVADNSQKNILDLEQALTISEVSEWHDKFLVLCDAGNPFSLNGGSLDIVDGTGLQLLAALMKEASEMHVAITWVAATDQLMHAADSIGLRCALGLDDVASDLV